MSGALRGFTSNGYTHLSNTNTPSGPAPQLRPNLVGNSNSQSIGTYSTPYRDGRTGEHLPRMTREEVNRQVHGTRTFQPQQSINDLWEDELHDYPEALQYGDFKGSFLGDHPEIIITLIEESTLYTIHDILPLEKWNGNMEFTMEVIEFNDTTWKRLPEEMPGDYMTDKKSRRRQTLHRFGKAITMERGFYKTPAGKRYWAAKIIQLGTALVTLMSYSVMCELMDGELIQKECELYDDGSLPPMRLADNFKYDLDTFAVFNRNPKAFRMIMNAMEDKYRRQASGHPEPDVVIIPRGVKKYVELLSEYREDYWKTGHPQGTGKNPLVWAIGNKRLYESIEFRQGDHMPSHDPFFRQKTVGTFVSMNDSHIRNIVPVKDFNYSMLNLKIYDEDCDGWGMLDYKQSFYYFGLYHGLQDWSVRDLKDDPKKPHPCGSMILDVLAQGIESVYEAYDRLAYDVDPGRYSKNLIEAIQLKPEALSDLEDIVKIPFNPIHPDFAKNSLSSRAGTTTSRHAAIQKEATRQGMVGRFGSNKNTATKVLGKLSRNSKMKGSTQRSRRRRNTKTSRRSDSSSSSSSSSDEDEDRSVNTTDDDDDEDSDLDDDDDSNWKQISKKLKVAKDHILIQYIRSLEKQRPEKDYPKRILNLLEDADKPLNVFLNFISKELLLDDLESDLRTLESSSIPKSNIEKKLIESEQRLSKVVSNTASDFYSECERADLQSISWNATGGNAEDPTDDISLFTDYYFEQNRSRAKLPFHANSLTVTSLHPVLFRLSPESVSYLVSKHGAVDYFIPPTDANLKRRYGERFCKFQASITLSLVFNLILQYQKSIQKASSNDEEDERRMEANEEERAAGITVPTNRQLQDAFGNLVRSIESILSPSPTVNGSQSQKQSVYDNLDNSTVLSCQQLLKPLIKLLVQVVQTKDNTAELKKLIENILKYTNPSQFEKNFFGGSGGKTDLSAKISSRSGYNLKPSAAHRGGLVFDDVTRGIYDGDVSDETAKESAKYVVDFAMSQRVERELWYENCLRAKGDEDLVPFLRPYDSFNAFALEYQYLYIFLTRALESSSVKHPVLLKGKVTVPKLNRTQALDAWKKIVTCADYLYFQAPYRFGNDFKSNNAELVHLFLLSFYDGGVYAKVDRNLDRVVSLTQNLKDTNGNVLNQDTLLQELITRANQEVTRREHAVQDLVEIALSKAPGPVVNNVYEHYRILYNSINDKAGTIMNEKTKGKPELLVNETTLYEILISLDILSQYDQTNPFDYEEAKSRVFSQLHEDEDKDEYQLNAVTKLLLGSQLSYNLQRLLPDLKYNETTADGTTRQVRYADLDAVLEGVKADVDKYGIGEYIFTDESSPNDIMGSLQKARASMKPDIRNAIKSGSFGSRSGNIPATHLKEKHTRGSFAYCVELLKGIKIRDGRFPMWAIKHGIMLPFGCIATRLAARYNCGSMLITRGGGYIGRTLHGNEDCTLGEDPKIGVVHGNASIYQKACVRLPQCIVRGFDVYVSNYFGGNGMKFFDHLNPTEVNHYKTSGTFPTRDFHLLAVWMDYQHSSWFHDVTGEPHGNLKCPFEERKSLNYPTSKIYSQIWGWDHSGYAPTVKNFMIAPTAEAGMNTLCFQAHQMRWHPKTQDYTDVTIERSPWGQNIGPGVGEARKGFVMYPPDYCWTGQQSTGKVC